MACDPNTLLEQAKCLNACIPQGMMQATEVALLCNIANAGGGDQFVLKTGDTMTGGLTINTVTPSDTLLSLLDPSIGAGFSELKYEGGAFEIHDSASDIIFSVDGSTGEIGFFGLGAATVQTSGANLTNNVTVGGVDNTIADFTSLTVYATDAAAIRNDIYQLARKLKQINDGLRSYGLFT